MKNIFKRMSDGFMWLKLDYQTSLRFFENYGVELYKLDINDGVETLITTTEDLVKAQKQGYAICVEIGFEKDIISIP